jgi:hypothetical protein
MSSILNSRADNLIALVAWLVCGGVVCGGTAMAQVLPRAPDYSDGAIAESAEQAGSAWKAWLMADRDLERDVANAPMVEARERIQRSFSALLNFTDKRRIYGERVADYIERYRPETAGRKPFVNVEVVNRDQLELLGISLSTVQARLDSLRDTAGWAAIRRTVQADRSDIMALQNARRDEIPVELPIGPAVPPRPLSVIVYRDSERQARELVERVWTHYYQALVDEVERKSGTSRPLVASITPPEHAPEPAPSATAPRVSGPDRVAGTWRYVEGSQQFNGVEEPHQVLLELFVEKGALTGRYRGTLTDFTGTHNVDVRLQQMAGAKGSSDIRLQYQNPEQNLSGQITVEGPGASGLDLMVVHMDAAGIPKGREILARR